MDTQQTCAHKVKWLPSCKSVSVFLIKNLLTWAWCFGGYAHAHLQALDRTSSALYLRGMCTCSLHISLMALSSIIRRGSGAKCGVWRHVGMSLQATLSQALAPVQHASVKACLYMLRTCRYGIAAMFLIGKD